MISDADKYNAEILKIAGFAMMTPFGRMIVQPTVVYAEIDSAIFFLIYAAFVLCLFYCGVQFVVRGHDILSLREK